MHVSSLTDEFRKLEARISEFHMLAVITTKIRKLVLITGGFLMLTSVTGKIRKLEVIIGKFCMLAVVTGEFRTSVLSFRMCVGRFITDLTNRVCTNTELQHILNFTWIKEISDDV